MTKCTHFDFFCIIVTIMASPIYTIPTVTENNNYVYTSVLFQSRERGKLSLKVKARKNLDSRRRRRGKDIYILMIFIFNYWYCLVYSEKGEKRNGVYRREAGENSCA